MDDLNLAIDEEHLQHKERLASLAASTSRLKTYLDARVSTMAPKAPALEDADSLLRSATRRLQALPQRRGRL
jgi:hypothetical protein